MSPTQRSLARLREEGYYPAVVEKWIPRVHIRRDLFGWIDLVAIHPQASGVLGIQVTTGANFSARRNKARNNPALIAWLTAGNRLALHGWRKLKGTWALRQELLSMTDLLPTS